MMQSSEQLVEGRRQELITDIISEVKVIKGVEFLSFLLYLIQSFKKKWGII